ncbi:MAG: SPASM domain-containing protein [Sulfurimonadaceae bacterium]|nr:SPASM domain-containing protein [Sulfurimonadaceae bacterium]
MKKFRKVHIEITNVCNLNCTFCPPKTFANHTMPLELFENINKQLAPITKELAYHLMGDPLVLKNLVDYLDISAKYNLLVNITTTANNLKQELYEILAHKTIKQINFSINSYNANSHQKSLQEYLSPILGFCDFVLKNEKDFFINLRLWNFDEEQSAKAFNKEVLKTISLFFDISIDIEALYREKPKNLRVARKIFLHFDDYFDWPSLTSPFVSETGFCYGLDSHFGILSSGVVVPCCLDKDAIITLGNINDSSIEDILNTPRAKAIMNGFKEGRVVEELCKKCSFRTRFDTQNEK